MERAVLHDSSPCLSGKRTSATSRAGGMPGRRDRRHLHDIVPPVVNAPLHQDELYLLCAGRGMFGPARPGTTGPVEARQAVGRAPWPVPRSCRESWPGLVPRSWPRDKFSSLQTGSFNRAQGVFPREVCQPGSFNWLDYQPTNPSAQLN